MPNTDLTLGSDATAANNLIIRADGAGGGSIRNGAGTELVKVPAGGVPAFRAYATSGVSISTTPAKVAFQNDSTTGVGFDTANAYDAATNYRFQPSVAGYYHVNSKVHFASSSYSVNAYIYKNGAVYSFGSGATSASSSAQVNDVVYLNGSTDYLEVYAYSSGAQNTDATDSSRTYFSGVLVRAA